MRRMSAAEKLARKLCWLEFKPPRRLYGTEAAYWATIHPAVRADRIRDAKRTAWEIAALRDAGAIHLIDLAIAERRTK